MTLQGIMSSTLAKRAEFLVRMLLAGAFVVAGGLKLLEPGSLAPVIGAFGLLPSVLVEPVAFVLPVLEIVIGAGVLLGSRRADVAMAGMLAVFLLVLGYGLWLGLDVDCGCYGPGDPEAEAFSSMQTSLIRDLFMLVACGFLLAKHRISQRVHTGAGTGDGTAQ